MPTTTPAPRPPLYPFILHISSFILLLPLLLLSPAFSQRSGVEEYSSLQRRGLAPGISRGTIRFQAPAGMTDVLFSEANLAQPLVAAEVVFPGGDPHRAVPLEVLANGVGALAAMGIELPPPPGNNPGLHGLRLQGGRLYSWPPAGEDHLMLLPEGALRLYNAEPGRGTVDFDDGTSLTLASLNGAFPGGGAAAAVYTGQLRPDELPVAAWTGNPVAVLLGPVTKGADPHALFLEPGPTERRFVPVGVLEREQLRTEPGQAVLILQPPVSPALMDRLRRRVPLKVTVELTPRERLAKAVTPIAPPAMRDGTLKAGLVETMVVRNALAFDAAGQKVCMVAPSRERARGFGVPLGRLLSFLAADGFNNLILLDGGRDLLLPQVSEPREQRDAANAPVRVALAILQSAPRLEIAGMDTSLHRVRSVAISGTRTEFPANLARALRDDKILQTPGLDSFWAIPAEKVNPSPGGNAENPNRLMMVLPRPMPIAAVELVHVESTGFSPEFNLKAYRIMGREKRDLGWRELVKVQHAAPVARERVAIPGSPPLIELRLEVLEPNFLSGGNVARLAEVFIWSTQPELQ